MEIKISDNAVELGKSAADFCAEVIKKAIEAKGKARIVLSTGASQFETLEALIAKDIDWSRVEMFHLDEYIGLPESHPASFRKYLKERFQSRINLGRAVYVIGEGNIEENINLLNKKLLEDDIDLGLIGIGENGHLAFNDPPADFDTNVPYIIVNLSESCKRQQVREGWFASLDDVPKQAISMSVKQIMKCRVIVSCVPHSVKASAIKDMLTMDVTNTVPATMLKRHGNVHLYLDVNSASLIGGEELMRWKSDE